MAEFCLKCFVDKILSDTEIPNIKAIRMSDKDDLCEGCNRYGKYVVSVDRYFDVVVRKDAKISANDLARYVIWYANKQKVRITLLMLQNLLFFIQIEYVEKNKSLLFDEDVSMGLYGPTIKSVNDEFCSNGALPLISMSEEDSDISCLSYGDVGLINKVLIEKMRLPVSSLVQESCQKLYPCLLKRKSDDNDKYRVTIDDFLSIANCSKQKIK